MRGLEEKLAELFDEAGRAKRAARGAVTRPNAASIPAA